MSQGATKQLAILGGTPAFSEKLHVGRPNIGNRERFLDRINGMLDRRWFSNDGVLVQEFEAALESYLGVKHCIAMCNATVGLEITARAVGLEGEVIVPSFTFIATPHSLYWQGITPVFCDVDSTTHNIDPAKVEQLITPKTTGILGVHAWGQGCAIRELTEIAKRHGLQLIFDAAHAFGCTDGGEMIGRFGRAEVFSFHATKFLNTFEGGAVATNDDELAEKIRLMKNFGFAGYDNVIYIGTNGKMNEACAAMGLTSLESAEEFISVNRRNHHLYSEAVRELEGISVLQYKPSEKNNYQYIVAIVDEDKAGVSRDTLVKTLWAENVMARRYFYPGCHRMEPYRTLCPNAGDGLPVTEMLCQRTLVLPNGTAIGAPEIDGIVSIIRAAVENKQALRAL